MRVLLTGGSGDLGDLVLPNLAKKGHEVINLDLRPPKAPTGEFIEGSILDRDLLAQIVPNSKIIIHIAALHGIHEFRRSESAHRFWDVNVTGTFNLLQAASDAGIRSFIFVSSTSVDDKTSFYGHTKRVAEALCESEVLRNPMLSVLTLRPRGFIPPWNREVYSSFVEWAKWFWGGAVHITDVADAVERSVQVLQDGSFRGYQSLVVDGGYDYSEEDLRDWDRAGEGTTFRKVYSAFYEMAMQHGLDPSKKPHVYDISETRRVLGYIPRYSLRNLLEELSRLNAS